MSSVVIGRRAWGAVRERPARRTPTRGLLVTSWAPHSLIVNLTRREAPKHRTWCNTTGSAARASGQVVGQAGRQFGATYTPGALFQSHRPSRPAAARRADGRAKQEAAARGEGGL